MLKIGIILGSMRPGRNGKGVADWVLENANKRGDAQYEIVDVQEYNLPLLDEAMPAAYGQYEKAHTKKWAEKIGGLDAFVFVTAEYNHALPGALKNAIDFIYGEWNNKAAGIVSYGSAGGARAAENLRLVLGELQVADVRQQVLLSLMTDFENFSVFKPHPRHEEELSTLLNQVNAWAGALKTTR